MSLLPPRISSIAHYLQNADKPWNWRVGAGSCPLCGESRFISLRANAFMTRCLRCKGNVTNLSLALVIERHFQGRYEHRAAYELSTYGSTLTWLQRRFPNVTTSEYFPNQPRGARVNGILNQDIQALTFQDESFDVITSNQVFEHVPDDMAGYRECLRTLKPGGAMIFSVPIHPIDSTRRVAKLSADGVVEFIGTPEFHDSRLGGKNSAPVFWHFSRCDIANRLLESGFAQASVVDVTICRIQGPATEVMYAIKRSK